MNNAAKALAAAERALRFSCCDQIHKCDSALHAPGPWSEGQWQRALAAYLLRDQYLLPEYTLLSFGAVAERARYVLANEAERAAILAGIRDAGGARDDHGRWMEVVA